MAEGDVIFPSDAVERNLALSGEVMRYMLNQPQVFHALPHQFELVILPEDDPEMRLYNLDLLDRFGSEGRAIVIVRLRMHEADRSQLNPSIFVSIAV